MYRAEILADEIGPSGVRLTSFEAEYPRLIHPEFLTHREFSRNSASSRAIPVKKLRERILMDPVFPVHWGEIQPGMVAEQELSPELQAEAKDAWLQGLEAAAQCSERLEKLRVHKQLANRPTEPWMFITTVITATEWQNFFGLRTAPDAQPEFQALAQRIAYVYYTSEPRVVPAGYWHLPYVRDHERALFPIEELRQISTARVCRVSYLTHGGGRDCLDKDRELHDSLVRNGHWSPFEHVAEALETAEHSGNFRGWKQYRKVFPEEKRHFYPTVTELEAWQVKWGLEPRPISALVPGPPR